MPVFRAGRIESKIFPDCSGRTGKKHRGLICLVLLLCARWANLWPYAQKSSINIIPKIRELDEFLDEHREYKNVLCEAHPELCFTRLKGQALNTKKKETEGLEERRNILLKYLKNEMLDGIRDRAKALNCMPDDIMDALCLAVSAAFKAHGMCETIPEKPEKDARGLIMQMIVPKIE